MGALLGRRRGKPTAAGIDRGWPHQVVVPATECTSSHGRFMEAFRLDLSVCERHHSVFHEDKWWIVYCFADPSTPRNSGSDSRRTVRSERSRPRHQLGAVVQEWTLSAYCRSMPTPPLPSSLSLLPARLELRLSRPPRAAWAKMEEVP
jgi:hypothetical protein